MIDKTYLERLRTRISELETEMSQPGVASDQKKMQVLMRDYSHQKMVASAVGTFLGLQDTVEESRELLADSDTDEELK
ncbi:MAG: PCRF domain-containing protein, partial [Kiritimatiellaceae bacterium]|nr:PCRF domain-containing protein [Kiritimatiellaceae bacterium]